LTGALTSATGGTIDLQGFDINANSASLTGILKLDLTGTGVGNNVTNGNLTVTGVKGDVALSGSLIITPTNLPPQYTAILATGANATQSFSSISPSGIGIVNAQGGFVTLKKSECDGIWITSSPSPSDWNSGSNWGGGSPGCVPGAPGSEENTATFPDVSSGVSTPFIVSLKGGATPFSPILHHLEFKSGSGTKFTIEKSGDSTITFKGGAITSPTISLSSGIATINAPIILEKETFL